METAACPIPALVDHVLAAYVEWRETTDAIANTYARWCVAPGGEEAAAGVYSESINELERRLWDSDLDRGSQPRTMLG